MKNTFRHLSNISIMSMVATMSWIQHAFPQKNKTIQKVTADSIPTVLNTTGVKDMTTTVQENCTTLCELVAAAEGKRIEAKGKKADGACTIFRKLIDLIDKAKSNDDAKTIHSIVAPPTTQVSSAFNTLEKLARDEMITPEKRGNAHALLGKYLWICINKGLLNSPDGKIAYNDLKFVQHQLACANMKIELTSEDEQILKDVTKILDEGEIGSKKYYQIKQKIKEGEIVFFHGRNGIIRSDKLPQKTTSTGPSQEKQPIAGPSSGKLYIKIDEKLADFCHVTDENREALSKVFDELLSANNNLSFLEGNSSDNPGAAYACGRYYDLGSQCGKFHKFENARNHYEAAITHHNPTIPKDKQTTNSYASIALGWMNLRRDINKDKPLNIEETRNLFDTALNQINEDITQRNTIDIKMAQFARNGLCTLADTNNDYRASYLATKWMLYESFHKEACQRIIATEKAIIDSNNQIHKDKKGKSKQRKKNKDAALLEELNILRQLHNFAPNNKDITHILIDIYGARALSNNELVLIEPLNSEKTRPTKKNNLETSLYYAQKLQLNHNDTTDGGIKIATLLYELGMLEIEDDQKDKGYHYLRQAADAGHSLATFLVGNRLFNENKYDEAQIYLAKVNRTELSPRNRRTWKSAYGRLLLNKDSNSLQALKLLEEAANEQEPEACLVYGELQYRQQNYPKAINYLKNIANKSPLYNWHLAIASLKQGKLEEAVGKFKGLLDNFFECDTSTSKTCLIEFINSKALEELEKNLEKNIEVKKILGYIGYSLRHFFNDQTYTEQTNRMLEFLGDSATSLNDGRSYLFLANLEIKDIPKRIEFLTQALKNIKEDTKIEKLITDQLSAYTTKPEMSGISNIQAIDLNCLVADYFFDKQNYIEAVKWFFKAKRLEPHQDNTHYANTLQKITSSHQHKKHPALLGLTNIMLLESLSLDSRSKESSIDHKLVESTFNKLEKIVNEKKYLGDELAYIFEKILVFQIFNYAMLSEELNNQKQALSFFKKAADHDHPFAKFKHAEISLKNNLRERDKEKHYAILSALMQRYPVKFDETEHEAGPSQGTFAPQSLEGDTCIRATLLTGMHQLESREDSKRIDGINLLMPLANYGYVAAANAIVGSLEKKQIDCFNKEKLIADFYRRYLARGCQHFSKKEWEKAQESFEKFCKLNGWINPALFSGLIKIAQGLDIDSSLENVQGALFNHFMFTLYKGTDTLDSFKTNPITDILGNKQIYELMQNVWFNQDTQSMKAMGYKFADLTNSKAKYIHACLLFQKSPNSEEAISLLQKAAAENNIFAALQLPLSISTIINKTNIDREGNRCIAAGESLTKLVLSKVSSKMFSTYRDTAIQVLKVVVQELKRLESTHSQKIQEICTKLIELRVTLEKEISFTF